MRAGARSWKAAYLCVAFAFLAMCARYYHPGYGLTALMQFPGGDASDELPAVRAVPIYRDPASGGYDGQFYAQLAVDPLLRNPAIDRAMDLAPYRAHRILFSWTAYAFGLGRPAWILQAYAVQNIAAWLLFGWLLCRWIPPVSVRAFVLWSGTMLAPGWVASVRNALPDGPSVLLLGLAVVAAESNRPVLSSLVVGISGLAREPNLLGGTLLVRVIRRRPRTWLAAIGLGVLCLLPLTIWLDYLRSIYHWRILVGGEHVTTPLSGLLWKIGRLADRVRRGGVTRDGIITALPLTSFVAQCAWLAWAVTIGRERSPWALVAAPFLLLGLTLHPVVFDGTPGAYTRVVLPLTVGVNVLLFARARPAPWWLIAAVNLGAVGGALTV